MARRSTRARAEEAADEDDDQEPLSSTSGPKLQFNQPLSWRVGKPIPISDLVPRLEALAAELKALPQGDIDKTSLIPVAKELAQQNLLAHKDKGVKALTACCLVDMLAICVPDAPFTPQQMQDIFNLIVSHSIPSLQDSSDPYYNRHIHVLHSLSEVKSIVLLADVPRPDPLVRSLFNTCFDILASPSEGQAKHLEYNITGLLQSFIEETQKLQLDVVELILTQFLRADPRVDPAASRQGKRQPVSDLKEANQSHLNFKQLPPAYHVAKSLCNSCAQQLVRPISLYFNQIIVDSAASKPNEKIPSKSSTRSKLRATHQAGSDEEEDQVQDDDVSEDDLKQLEKAHRLLKEIWRSAPRVLQGVIPQVEAELSRDNVKIRLLATDAVGDMVSGIGAAGPPSIQLPDPATYPPLELSASSPETQTENGIAPSSALSFVQAHPSTYQQFVGRRNDKSPEIRAVWAEKIGNILSTSAGGLGMGATEEQDLAKHFAQLLIDSHENVRTASIRAVSSLDLQKFILKFGATGGISSPGSILANLTDRVRDRKQTVRNEATRLLARLWAAGYGELVAENEQVEQSLDPIPSKILNALYASDTDINAIIDEVLFESLLPLEYPKMKGKTAVAPQPTGRRSTRSADTETTDKDMIRTERILFMYTKLDERAKLVMLALMGRPSKLSDYMKAFLKRCEDYNGGVMENNGPEIKKHLGQLIEFFAKTLPDHSRAVEDLWKFAKIHDRRWYALIRFCMADDSDYNKVYRSIRELTRRMDESSSGSPTFATTVRLLVLRSSNIFYNRSHVHPIIEFSRNEKGKLASAAHELLKDISSKRAGVFKAHGKELCGFLEQAAPTEKKPCDTGTLDALKACASFATRYPKDVPKEKKFMQAMIQYALHGTPPATAKHAVTIILSSTDKKEMYASDLLHKCVKGFSYGSPNFLARLASLSQLMCYSSSLLNDTTDIDSVLAIAIGDILSQCRTGVTDTSQPTWDDEVDEECEAKIWALKIVVNRLRSFDDAQSVQEISKHVYQLLNNLVSNSGELNSTTSTPPAHRSRLRLEAALLLVKLSSHQDFDILLTPEAFNDLALVAQDPNSAVRERFITKIKKYLGHERLPSRFYTIVFLLAFEPTRKLQRDSQTWLKARAIALAKARKPIMEQVLARFISLLAHHPDFDDDNFDSKIKYLIFFLEAVATPDNVSLLYHVAQRVKTVQDVIDSEKSGALYYLSDLAITAITQFASLHNWSLESYAGKIRLPSSLFSSMPSNEVAHRVAAKFYLADEETEQIESIVRSSMKPRKRKPEDEPGQTSPAKKRRAPSSVTKQAASSTGKSKARQSLPLRKAREKSRSETPRSDRPTESSPTAERRRSGRVTRQKNYAEDEEVDDDIDTQKVEQHQNSKNGVKERSATVEIMSSPPPEEQRKTSPPKTRLRARR